MLSITMITAISVFALPHLRITTLSMMRSMTLAYALAAFTIVRSSTPMTMAPLSGSIVIDTMGTYMVVAALVVQLVVMAYHSTPVTTTMGTPYTVTILTGVLLVGSYYLIMSADMMTLVISLEVQSFSLYALSSVYRWREGATSAGLMYFMLGAFSSGLVLLGLSMTYVYAGQTDWASLVPLAVMTDDRLMATSLVVTMSGLLFKVTAAPFHYWGPEVYDRVPTVITVVINIMPKFALLAIIMRYTTLLDAIGIQTYLYMSAVASWVIGSVVGLVQTRIKRLLAYSTVSHVGWMLAAMACGTSMGLGSVMYYLLQYSLTSVLTFLTLIAMGTTLGLGGEGSGPNMTRGTPGTVNVGGTNTGLTDVVLVSSMNGLYARSVVMTLAVAVTLFSAAGIPPLAGFYAKLSVMQAMLFDTSPLYIVVGVVSSVVSAGFYLSVIAAMLFNTPAKS